MFFPVYIHDPIVPATRPPTAMLNASSLGFVSLPLALSPVIVVVAASIIPRLPMIVPAFLPAYFEVDFIGFSKNCPALSIEADCVNTAPSSA